MRAVGRRQCRRDRGPAWLPSSARLPGTFSRKGREKDRAPAQAIFPGPKMHPHSPAEPKSQRQPIYLVLAIIVGVLGLAVPAIWQNYVASLGVLDLDVLGQGSTVVLDREGRLLRAFTTTDGRWRLPVSHKDVDPRFPKLLT